MMIVRDPKTLSKVDREVGKVTAIVRSENIVDICGYIDPVLVKQLNLNTIIFMDGAERLITHAELSSDGNWLASIDAGKIGSDGNCLKLKTFASSASNAFIYPLRIEADALESYVDFARSVLSIPAAVVTKPEVQSKPKERAASKLRIFYLGAQTHLNLDKNPSLAELLTATGNNTGNMLIGHAIKRQLDALEISSDFSLGHKKIEENFDLIVIGAANFIAPYFDFEVYAKFLDAVRLPVVIIGLGAQARNYGARVEMPKGTERMLRIIAERTVSLGVRGYFTAANLYDMGIKNVRVIGCPSMYWTCQPTMSLRWSPGKNPLAVAVNGSGVSITQSFDVKAGEKVEATLARLSFKQNYTYVLQNEKALMEMERGDQPAAEPLATLMKRYGCSDLSPDEFTRYVRKNMKTYFDIDRWIADTRELDFVMGTRFHGCLIALLAGIPGLVFVHDSRTREMCELLRIPNVDVRNAGNIDVNALYNSLDLSGVETAYRHLYQNYISFLEENHLAHRLSD